MKLTTTIKVVFAFNNFVPATRCLEEFCKLASLNLQYKIFTIHFYEAFLVIIENEYVLPIRERQFLYITFTVLIFATGHICLA